jgi:UDP-3-O-[3-hydroxymyristoyl] glucosamine N-acyltransferase
LKLKEIAARLECRLEGDGEIDIRRVTGIEDAGPGDLTFFVNPKYAAELRTTKASAVILGDQAEAASCAMLRARQPYFAFARAVELFADPWKPAPGVHRLAWVSESAVISDGASIGPFAVIEDGARIGARTIVHAHVTIARHATVGEDCTIHARVSLRERVRIGDRVVLQDGAVIGSDGFGFARRPEGGHHKIPQIGNVVIEDDVEIGANTTIDRPAVGETRIRAGTKIDNLVHIAHGVSIGRRSLLAAQVGIAGSTIVEDDVMMAGQSGVAGHVRVGARARIGAKSAVLQSVDAGSFVTGHPAFDHTDWRKASVVFRQLPWLKKRVEELERRIVELEEKLAACPPPVDR